MRVGGLLSAMNIHEQQLFYRLASHQETVLVTSGMCNTPPAYIASNVFLRK